MKTLNRKKKIQITSLVLVLFVALFVVIAVPSFARYKNRSSKAEATVWDGTVANSYRKGTGTSVDPYVISNGAEFAYFQSQLENTNYENTYFVLGSDIVLNDGVFAYDTTNGLTYTKDGNTVNVTPYQNSYQNIQVFPSIKQFKGTLNGNGYRIYGLFITKSTSDGLGLFTDLEGTINDLYITNSIIYGGSITGGVAARAKNATISNVMFDGSVIGRSETVDSSTSIELADFTKTIDNTTDTELVSVARNKIDGKITNIKATGNLTISDSDGTVTLNGQTVSAGDFEISLGQSLGDLNFEFTSTANTTYEVSNLRYTVYYSYGNSAGIVSDADSVTLLNIAQRGNIYGSVYAAGLINDVDGNTSVTNCYNVADINGVVGSGLINRIEYDDEQVTISTSYNSGAIYGTNAFGLVGSISTSTVNINNSFNQNNNFTLGHIEFSNVTVNNVACSTSNFVSSGTITGNIINSNDLKAYARTIGFDEFVDPSDLAVNASHIWVYQDSPLPILALDDINNTLATIHVGDHSWNNVGYELNPLKFTSLSFSIQEVDHLRPIKTVSYYIHKSKTPLSKSEIEAISDWETYSSVVNVPEEGFYIIYAKVTDYNDTVSYLNTDLLILDLSGSSISMSIGNDTWTEVNSSVSTKYLSSNGSLNITAVDELSGVKSIKYYVSNSVLSAEQIESVDSWTDYSGSITIDSTTGAIVYAKVTDNTNYVSYANTDRLLVGGYRLTNMIAGRSTSYNTNINITDKSSVSMYYSFTDSGTYPNGVTHSITFSDTLPVDTMITIMDRNRSKAYKYRTTALDDETIYFTSFREIGTTNNFSESIYTGAINEDYKIIVDFSNTELSNNITGLSATLSLNNGLDSVIETVGNVDSFNVITNSNASSLFSSNYSGTVYYNTDDTYQIPITGSLQFGTYQSDNVIDTTLEDKSFGLALKMVDSNENIVSKMNLQNIKFKIGNKYFFMDNDSVVRMDLGTGLGNVNTDLVIETNSANIQLPNGTYTFKIGYYTSYDGTYSSDITYFKDVTVSVADSSYLQMQKFQVKMDDEDRILDKASSKQFNVSILQDSSYNNASVKVRLLRKTSFSAADQSYTEIDLGEYSNSELTKYSGNIYNTSITGNNSNYRDLSFDLDTESLGSGAYSLTFDLYHGDTYIKSITKKIMIR